MRIVQLLVLTFAYIVAAAGARANPVFARQYGLSCSTCHSGYPRLNAFGLAFKSNNFRLPGQEKDAKLVWRRTVPIAIQVKPTDLHFFNNPGSSRVQFTETQILAGGLIAPTTAFYMHHTQFLDGIPQPFPNYELWFQHVFDERRKIMLKVGQFELPYAYSSEINRTTVSLPLILFRGLQSRDVLPAVPMTGLQISGRQGDRFQWMVAGGAPAAVNSSNPPGERQFFGRFKDVFLRASTGAPSRNGGLFAYITRPRRIVAGSVVSNDAWNVGADGVFIWGENQVHAMLMYGENNDPLGTGRKGVLRGGFVELDRMIKPWIGLTGRWDIETLSRSNGRSYLEARTIGLRVYPAPRLRFSAEYQDLDHGRSSTAFLATVVL